MNASLGASIDSTDFNELVYPGFYDIMYNGGVDQAKYHAPLGVYTAGAWYTVGVFGYLDTRITQIAYLPYNFQQKMFIRYKHDVTWSTWRELATATPPQEYDLPLAAGLSSREGFKNIYYKTQNGQVFVHGYLHKSGTSDDIPNGTYVFALPHGYCPAEPIKRICRVGTFSQGDLQGDLIVYPGGGGLLLLPVGIPFAMVSFDFEFLAS